MQFLWKYIDDIIGKGLEWYVITELLLYTSATLVPMALPLAILLSSIMTFGNLGENYELVALKSAGISLQRIMLPLIIVSVFISVLAFYFSNNVMPIANLKFNALLFDVRNQRPQLTIKEGIFNNDIEGYSIKVQRKDNVNNTLHDIIIYDHKAGNGNKRVTIAESGTMILTKDKQYLILTLKNGYVYEEAEPQQNKKNSLPHQREKFEEQTVNLELTGFRFSRTSENLFNNNYQMFSVKQLSFAIDSLKDALKKNMAHIATSLSGNTYFKEEQVMPVQAAVITPDISKGKSLITGKDTLRTIVAKPATPIVKIGNTKYNIDSLYQAIEYNKHIETIDLAINNSRATKSFISSSKEEFELRKKNIRRHEIEWHRKFTLSFACMVLFFIGAPLGAIIRKGGLGMPMVVSVILFIIYYVISISGEKFVREEVLLSYQGMWLSSAILLPFGIFLTYKAANESTLLDTDSYKQFFKKLRNISKKKA